MDNSLFWYIFSMVFMTVFIFSGSQIIIQVKDFYIGFHDTDNGYNIERLNLMDGRNNWKDINNEGEIEEGYEVYNRGLNLMRSSNLGVMYWSFVNGFSFVFMICGLIFYGSSEKKEKERNTIRNSKRKSLRNTIRI